MSFPVSFLLFLIRWHMILALCAFQAGTVWFCIAVLSIGLAPFSRWSSCSSIEKLRRDLNNVCEFPETRLLRGLRWFVEPNHQRPSQLLEAVTDCQWSLWNCA